MSIYPYADKKTGLIFTGPPEAHGEVTITPILALPLALGAAIPPNGTVHIVGHSESGNHHVLDRTDDIERWRDIMLADDVLDENDVAPARSFLRVIGDDVRLLHQKSEGAAHRHGDSSVKAGAYLVTTGLQYTPEGLRRVAD